MNVNIRQLLCLFTLIPMGFLFTNCFVKNLPGGKAVLEELERQRIEHAEQMVKKSSNFQEVDKICKEIPVPKSSKFVTKSVPDDAKILISYYYISEEKYEVLKPFLMDYFRNDNWELVNDDIGVVTKITEFRKGPYTVVMQFGGMEPDATYAFSCKKIQPE